MGISKVIHGLGNAIWHGKFKVNCVVIINRAAVAIINWASSCYLEENKW